MHVEVTELDDRFIIDLTADTAEDAARLVRLGMNGTKTVCETHAAASKHGRVFAWVVVGNRVNDVTDIPKAR